MQVIPAIDIKGGKCVRLLQGDPSREIVYSADPIYMASKWKELGATFLHIIDLDGAREGNPKNLPIVAEIVSTLRIPVQVGGGIRRFSTIETYLSLGIERIILGTQALRSPGFVEECCKRYPDKILLSIDSKDGYLAYEGWEKVSGIEVEEFIKAISDCPLRGYIFTDIKRDGMLSGANLRAIGKFVRSVNRPVLAAGGISSLAEVKELISLEPWGLEGIILGRALYEGTLDFKALLDLVQC